MLSYLFNCSNILAGLTGVSKREEWGVVRAACVGQRSASGRRTVHALHQLSRSATPVKLHPQPSPETDQRSL